MDSFGHIWQLLNPHPKYFGRKRACYEIWIRYSLEEQRAIYHNIKVKLAAGKFVNYNPYFAIKENAPRPEPTEMSFDDYYKRFGTTVEQDGWKMTNPTGNKVIYVKQ